MCPGEMGHGDMGNGEMGNGHVDPHRLEGEDVKILSSNPQKALLCVNTRLWVYRVSKSVQRPEL